MRYFADIVAPLYALLYKEATWHLTDTEEFSMYSLCTELCKHPVFDLPDFTKQFQTEGDVFDTDIDGILTK